MSAEPGVSQGTTQPTDTTVGGCDRVDKVPDIVLYTTSCAANAKVQSDTRRLKYLLKAKHASYREIDLSENPLARFDMLEQSDCIVEVPQIHVNGRFIGTAEDIQEQEDFGELDDLLDGEDPTEVIERTKQAIADRLLLERENKEPVVVARKPALDHTHKE